ncbi:MCE family protein, partial [Mycobacterium kansasii]
MSNYSADGALRPNRVRVGRIDPIWYAPILFVVVAGLIAFTTGAFSGKFEQTIPLTLVSDRAGL